jgi:hypothetical protein
MLQHIDVVDLRAISPVRALFPVLFDAIRSAIFSSSSESTGEDAGATSFEPDSGSEEGSRLREVTKTFIEKQ